MKSYFRGIVDVCLVHETRLRWSILQFTEHKPFTAKSVSRLADTELAIFDQFTVRFSKPQDVMGVKLLPAALELTHEKGELGAFIDKLNGLEKIGALSSAE